MHLLIGLFQRGLVQVEGVGVLHQKLARAHDAEPGSDLIPHFGLYLVEIKWELLITFNLIPHQAGDDFFVCGAQAKVPRVAVLNAQ